MRIVLDVENYRIRREESIVRLAYTTADKVLHKLDELNLTDYIFNMYEMYHSEALENAYADIDKLIESKTK